ncbi:MAG: nucleotide disphospho-sugar-binding domain-containing protein, partial [Bacteroidota bacterium]
GHEVTLTAPRDLGQKVGGLGVPFLRLPTIDERPELGGEALSTRKGNRWTRLLDRYRKREVNRLRSLALTDPTDFAQTIDRLQPDALICDVELHEYIITAYGRGLKLLLLSQWYSLWDRPGLPYLLHDTIPGQGWAGSRLALWLSWHKIRWRRRWLHQKIALLSFGADRRSTLLALAKQEGFPRRFIRKSFWPGAFTYEGLPVLAMAPLEMEFPHTPPSFLQYVGPMVYANRTEKTVAALTAIFEQQERTGAKLLLCTVSTMTGVQDDFLSRLVQAVATRTDWMLVLGLGGKNDELQLPAGADNVFTFSYVPQLAVLARADLSINHGGIHTIHECLHFGVPMLVYSGKRSDQNGCAARVQYHGLGLMADRDQDAPEAIRAKINYVLTEDSFQEQIMRMQTRIANYAQKHILEERITIETTATPTVT